MVALHPSVDIYRGRDPAHLPLYSVPEAAHHLHQPTTTVRSWTLGRNYRTSAGPRTFQPIVRIETPKERLLSFLNLTELHVLSLLRRIHRIKLPAIRRAIAELRKRFHSTHPLAEKQMWTDGKDLFIDQFGEYVNLTDYGQMEMKKIIEAYLARIERNRSGVPVRLFPFVGSRLDSPNSVQIDPRIRFGQPCITGTRIPTAILAERQEAGDSVARLAKDYGRSPEEIQEALRYEGRRVS